MPYTKNPDLFYDPALRKEEEKGPYAYAFNGALSLAKTPPKPETVPMVYDSVVPLRNASDLFESLPYPGRHKGRDMVVYADGHAKGHRGGAVKTLPSTGMAFVHHFGGRSLFSVRVVSDLRYKWRIPRLSLTISASRM